MVEAPSLDAALAEARALAEAEIAAALAGEAGPVADAMRYAVAGGKGLRALLVLQGAGLHGVAPADAAGAAAAIEALHAYSLVHDDLPSMDDDDLRRGRPTVHRAWDEATAVLAGDALQSLAFELLLAGGGPAEARARLALLLARAAGVAGMVGGQAEDIAAETAPAPLPLDAVTGLQARKTGALITWAACAGPRLAGEDDAPLRRFGDALGLAFQIADDLLDVEGEAAVVGKAVAKDAAAGKATFVSHLGVAGARARARALVAEAEEALAPYGDHPAAATLRAAARFALDRRR